MSTVRFSRTPAIAALVIATACGTGPSPQVNAGARSNDTANVARQANEPRSLDPTGSTPPPMAPSPGATANIGPTAGPTATGKPGGGTAPDGNPPDGDPAAASSSKRADPPRKIGARHVLVQWMGTERAPTNVVRSREQAYAVAQEVLRRAKSGEDFARLAIEYSDEPGAGARGGSLGRFGRGQMVGAFETAVYKLDVGQISDIVESPFGFHVIQRTE